MEASVRRGVQAPYIPYMGGCQNYGPFLGALNIRCRIITGIQKGTIILTSTHIVHVQGVLDFIPEPVAGASRKIPAVVHVHHHATKSRSLNRNPSSRTLPYVEASTPNPVNPALPPLFKNPSQVLKSQYCSSDFGLDPCVFYEPGPLPLHGLCTEIY